MSAYSAARSMTFWVISTITNFGQSAASARRARATAAASPGTSRTRRASAACASAQETRQVATASAPRASFFTAAEPASLRYSLISADVSQ